MIIAYSPVLFGAIFAASLLVFLASVSEPTNERAATISGTVMIASLLIALGTYMYGLSIADVSIKCIHYEVVDIREGEKDTLVLKTDEGGYFEQEASLADIYELNIGDDYWAEFTISTVEGVEISSNGHYVYTCAENNVERIER